MELILLTSIFIGFIVTIFFTPLWIKRAKVANHVGKDMNKLNGKSVAESGGIGAIFGFVLGTLFYISINTFYFNTSTNLIQIFALLSSILIISFIGFLDDLFGWKIGLTKKTRIFFLIFAAVPLMVINAGVSEVIGLNIGLWYALLLIPLGIVGASTTYNFLAGYNGLEASQGILILGGLAIVTFFTGNSWLSLICLVMIASLIGFFIYNKYPAKAFPGDVLTNPVGALIAIVAILGNIEMVAVFFFIPYIIETILKSRGKLKKESFGKVNSEGYLEMPYEKFYGLEHVAIYVQKKLFGRASEKGVVYLINFFQILLIALGLIIFRNSIF